MRKIALTIAVLGSIASLPFASFGQSSDAKYCQALTDTYRRVVGSNAASGDA